jgi:hypothetical protein
MSDELKIDALRATIKDKLPFCSGWCSLAPNDYMLFYKKGDYTRSASSILFFDAIFDSELAQFSHVDLSRPTGDELRDLSAACDPATFGVHNEDRLDESYRKAGKLDYSDFATRFHPMDSGLIDIIHSELVGGGKAIRAELYKLNVYGLFHTCCITFSDRFYRLFHGRGRGIL